MDHSGWFIESVSCSGGGSVRSKEGMEKIIPSELPHGWEEISRDSGDGFIRVKLGHLSPYPKHEQVPCIKVFVGEFPSSKLSKYDLVSDLTVSWVEDKDILDLEKTQDNIYKELEEAKRKLEQIKGDKNSFSKELKEIESFLKNAKKDVPKFKEVQYLGEKARATIDENGEKRIFSILVNGFSIYGSMVSVASQLDPGSKPIHSISCEKTWQKHEPIRVEHGCNCKACSCHLESGGCSTLKKEGYVHREEVENLLRLIISRIKGGGKKPEKKSRAEIVRSQKKIESPEEGMELKKGDIINTKNAEITIKDNLENEIHIKNNTEIKLGASGVSEKEIVLEQTIGEILAKIKKLPKDYDLRVRTPQAVCGVRGTIFGLHVEKYVTTITVVEGKVELSDLRGNRVIVGENQFCICSGEQGLQTPVNAPFDLKEKFEKLSKIIE